jgi:hypothetical protein
MDAGGDGRDIDADDECDTGGFEFGAVDDSDETDDGQADADDEQAGDVRADGGDIDREAMRKAFKECAARDGALYLDAVFENYRHRVGGSNAPTVDAFVDALTDAGVDPAVFADRGLA